MNPAGITLTSRCLKKEEDKEGKSLTVTSFLHFRKGDLLPLIAAGEKTKNKRSRRLTGHNTILYLPYLFCLFPCLLALSFQETKTQIITAS